MPRSRMIKPEFWDDEKLASVSRDARLLFEGLWTYSDDYGVVKGNLKWLQNKIFPYDTDITAEIFGGWINQLESGCFIAPFEASGEKYYYIRNFQKHQTVDHPSKLRNPSPPRSLSSRKAREDSRQTRGKSESESETESKTEAEGKVSPAADIPDSFWKSAKEGISEIFDEAGLSELLDDGNLNYLIRLCWEYNHIPTAEEMKKRFVHKNSKPLTKSNLRFEMRKWFELAWKYTEANHV